MMKPYSIVLVTHYFPSYGGGIENTAYSLAEKLCITGNFSIRWFASSYSTPPETKNWLECQPVYTCRVLRKLGMDWPVWSLKGLLQLQSAIKKTDVVHVHEYIYCGSIAAFIFAKWYRKPVVVTQHMGNHAFKNSLLNCIVKLCNRTLGRVILAHANKVIFISQAVKHEFEQHIKFRIPAEYWPNGVDTDIFHPITNDERISLRTTLRGTDKPIVLFVGRFLEKKGLALLRQLSGEMPEIDWWFAGHGERDSAFHPKNWNNGHIRIFENRRGSDLAMLYQAADLLVLPSFGEGFPLVVQESIACGTPALVTPEIASGDHDAANLMFTCSLTPETSKKERWKTAVSTILFSPTLKRLKADEIDPIVKKWSWDHRASQYKTLFEQVCTEQQKTGN